MIMIGFRSLPSSCFRLFKGIELLIVSHLLKSLPLVAVLLLHGEKLHNGRRREAPTWQQAKQERTGAENLMPVAPNSNVERVGPQLQSHEQDTDRP